MGDQLSFIVSVETRHPSVARSRIGKTVVSHRLAAGMIRRAPGARGRSAHRPPGRRPGTITRDSGRLYEIDSTAAQTFAAVVGRPEPCVRGIAALVRRSRRADGAKSHGAGKGTMLHGRGNLGPAARCMLLRARLPPSLGRLSCLVNPTRVLPAVFDQVGGRLVVVWMLSGRRAGPSSHRCQYRYRPVAERSL